MKSFSLCCAAAAPALILAVASIGGAHPSTAVQGPSIEGPRTCEEGARIVLTLGTTVADERWTWRQVRGPKAKLEPAGPRLEFNAPQELADYELEFECSANNGATAQSARHVIKVSADDDPPLAQTFVAPHSECGAILLLTGQGQNPEILQGITYQWRQVGEGPRVKLEYADRPQAWCTPPENAAGYKLAFEFAVSDGVNPPTVAKVEVALDCDPRSAPLAPEAVLALPRDPFVETTMPRGAWVMSGVLRLEPNAPDKPAALTLRLATSPKYAAAVNFESREGRGLLRRYGMQRDDKGVWSEPALSGNQDLGSWALESTIGFELSWNGFELAIRSGEPGKRAEWEEPPFPNDMKLSTRPKSLVLDVSGAKFTLESFELRGK